MKRIKAACLEQTIHFQLKEDLPREEAVDFVELEYQRYLQHLDHCRTAYRVLEEQRLEDGSILVMLKKQYNHYDCTPYLP